MGESAIFYVAVYSWLLKVRVHLGGRGPKKEGPSAIPKALFGPFQSQS